MPANLPGWLVFVAILVGSGGVAAAGGVVTTFLRDRRVGQTEERSVTIVEVEKAIPGLGEIIRQLRDQNTAQAQEIDRINGRNQNLVAEVFRLEQRVTDLEHDLAVAKGHA